MTNAAINDVTFSVEKQPIPGLFDFLEANEFGHSGVRYQRRNLKEQWGRFINPTLLCAWVESSIVGCYVLDERSCLIGDEPALGIYRGLLCVHPDYRRTGVSAQLIQLSGQLINESVAAYSGPVFSYGCIDATNTPSLRLLSGAGCRSIGRLHSQLTYRQWPRSKLELVEVEGLYIDGFKGSVEVDDECGSHSSTVRDVSAVPLTRLAYQDCEGDRLSATIARTSLKMTTLGRVNDALVSVFVKPFPFAKRRFNPDNFQYISLIHVYVRPGCESDWKSFITSLVARYKVHYASMIADPRTDALHRLQLAGMYNSSAGQPVDVMVRDENTEAKALLSQTTSVHLYPVDL